MRKLNAVAACISSLCLVASAHGGVVAPKKPSDLRVVAGNYFSSPACPGLTGGFTVDQQQSPDGTSGTFSIPAGSVFIITGWDFNASPFSGFVQILLAISNGSSVSQVAVGIATGSGTAGATMELPVGAPVKAGSTLCYHPFSSVVSQIRVRGFIAKDN